MRTTLNFIGKLWDFVVRLFGESNVSTQEALSPIHAPAHAAEAKSLPLSELLRGMRGAEGMPRWDYLVQQFADEGKKICDERIGSATGLDQAIASLNEELMSLESAHRSAKSDADTAVDDDATEMYQPDSAYLKRVEKLCLRLAELRDDPAYEPAPGTMRSPF